MNETQEYGKIEVISARKMYENIYPGNSHKWKEETFKNLI